MSAITKKIEQPPQRVYALYLSGESVQKIADIFARYGVTRRHVHWLIDQARRESAQAKIGVAA